MFPSRVYDENEDLFDRKIRSSKQCWLKEDRPIIKNIMDRVKSYTNTYNNYFEDLQVVNYPPGGFYKPHYDACDGDNSYCQRMNKDMGQRYLTVLIYLNDNYDGGETIFPEINKLVKPEKGKAVIFKNVDNKGVVIKQALHGGNPIKNGEKWIANSWIRLN
jgi:prolyl 4-hydroxylase